MDGTTAGSLGSVLPAPRPPASGGGNLLHVDHTVPATPQPVAVPPPAPIAPVLPAAPQFSQLTPVYAPTPTNTVADIPQPAVKGIEFVQAPPPLPPVVPLPAPPSLSPSQQLMQSTTIQPVTPPVQAPAPVVTQPPTAPVMSGPEKYASIENHLEDVDLDQTLGVTNAPSVPNMANTPEPAVVRSSLAAAPPTIHDEAVRTYFQTSSQAATDVPVTPTGFSLKNLNPVLIRRVAIIAGIVIVLGVGGYFIVSAIIGSQKTAQTSTTTQTPAVTQPSFNEQQAGTDTTTDTSGSSTDTTTTPATDTTTPATTTTPVVTTTPVTTTPTTTTPDPGVASTGLEW